MIYYHRCSSFLYVSFAYWKIPLLRSSTCWKHVPMIWRKYTYEHLLNYYYRRQLGGDSNRKRGTINVRPTGVLAQRDSDQEAWQPQPQAHFLQSAFNFRLERLWWWSCLNVVGTVVCNFQATVGTSRALGKWNNVCERKEAVF